MDNLQGSEDEQHEQVRDALIMEITNFRAASVNAFNRFHGQEEGEDEVMDKYWKLEKEAEAALYSKIIQLIEHHTQSLTKSLLAEVEERLVDDEYVEHPTCQADVIAALNTIRQEKGIES